MSPDRPTRPQDEQLLALLRSLAIDPSPSFVERLSRRIARGGRITALVVEDDDASRRLLEIQLGRRGFEVELAPDGDQALANPRLGEFDLILLDQRMPRLTGLEVAAAVRERGIDTPMVIFSGFSEEIQKEAWQLGIRAISKTEWELLFEELDRLVPGGTSSPEGEEEPV
jgi:CheY-like chemotaxis protein